MSRPATSHHEESLNMLQTLSVLYVEDDEEVRNELARFLSRRVRLLEVAAADLHRHAEIITADAVLAFEQRGAG